MVETAETDERRNKIHFESNSRWLFSRFRVYSVLAPHLLLPKLNFISHSCQKLKSLFVLLVNWNASNPLTLEILLTTSKKHYIWHTVSPGLFTRSTWRWCKVFFFTRKNELVYIDGLSTSLLYSLMLHISVESTWVIVAEQTVEELR